MSHDSNQQCSMAAATHTGSSGEQKWHVHTSLCLPSHEASAITWILLLAPARMRVGTRLLSAAAPSIPHHTDNAADTWWAWDTVTKPPCWILSCHSFHFPLLKQLCMTTAKQAQELECSHGGEQKPEKGGEFLSAGGCSPAHSPSPNLLLQHLSPPTTAPQSQWCWDFNGPKCYHWTQGLGKTKPNPKTNTQLRLAAQSIFKSKGSREQGTTCLSLSIHCLLPAPGHKGSHSPNI